MGIYGLSDAAKVAAGKPLDPRSTEEARAKTALERSVIPFPRLRDVPEPSIPLQEAGRKTYDSWARRLRDSGLLTVITAGFIEQLALADDAIRAQSGLGKMPSSRFLEIRRGALLKLESLNVDHSLVPDPDKQNRFARNGFPGRRAIADGAA